MDGRITVNRSPVGIRFLISAPGHGVIFDRTARTRAMAEFQAAQFIGIIRHGWGSLPGEQTFRVDIPGEDFDFLCAQLPELVREFLAPLIGRAPVIPTDTESIG